MPERCGVKGYVYILFSGMGFNPLKTGKRLFYKNVTFIKEGLSVQLKRGCSIQDYRVAIGFWLLPCKEKGQCMYNRSIWNFNFRHFSAILCLSRD